MIDFGAMVCIVMCVAQLWKKSGLKKELIPLLNLLVGLLLSFIWFGDLSYPELIQQGLIVGLSASGVYEVGACLKHK